MSKIHEAMRRAEREGRGAFARRSAGEENPAEPFQLRTSPNSRPLASNILQVEPDRTTHPVVEPLELSELREKTISPHRNLVVLSEHESAERTAYLDLKARLLQVQRETGLKTILITSTMRGEGKSLTATNLALSLSREPGQRVLLIDANLKNPSLGHFLGLNQAAGISELLRKSRPAKEVVLRTDVPNFYVLMAGSDTNNSKEILNTQRMLDFLVLVRRRFEWVILDSPPLIPEPDADLISSMVDGTLLVVGASSDSASSLFKGTQMLRSKKIIGVVRNDGPQLLPEKTETRGKLARDKVRDLINRLRF